MLPVLTVPAGLGEVLQVVGGAFAAPTFATFVALVTGYLGATGRRTVTGMWIAAGLAGVAHHARAHRFFSHAVWDLDVVGLLLARAVVAAFAPGAVSVVVDDTLFHRFGRRVFGCCWQHDGSARGRDGIGRGNCFVIAGSTAPVPATGREVFFPPLFRRYRPKHGPSKPDLARAMVGVLARSLHPRRVQVVVDAAYRSPGWRSLPAAVTCTTRLPANAVLYAPAPPRTGRRGRPRTKGARLGTAADLAAAAAWRTTTTSRYGAVVTIEVAVVDCLWYGSLGGVPVHVVLVRDQRGRGALYDIAVVTTDRAVPAETVVCRYAARWSVEQAIKDGKDLLGCGDAQHRVQTAVERSVPFAMLCQTILVLWYTRIGNAEADIAARRATTPWYQHKTNISLDDMLVAFRRARITTVTAAHNAPAQFTPAAATCTSAAA